MDLFPGSAFVDALSWPERPRWKVLQATPRIESAHHGRLYSSKAVKVYKSQVEWACSFFSG